MGLPKICSSRAVHCQAVDVLKPVQVFVCCTAAALCHSVAAATAVSALQRISRCMALQPQLSSCLMTSYRSMSAVPVAACSKFFFFFFFWVTGELSTLRQMMKVPNKPGLSPDSSLENV